MQCLAWAVVSGRSMKSWAEAHGLDVRLVREASRLPEVTEMIAGHRSRLDARTAARTKTRRAPAIDRVAGLFAENSSGLPDSGASCAREKLLTTLVAQRDHKACRRPGDPRNPARGFHK